MAFPGTRNFDYYRGDTSEFNIYPKKTDGSVFDLTGYSVAFTIAPSRGSAGLADQITAYSSITLPGTVSCTIRPVDGRQLLPGTTYVYDVQITKSGTPDIIYTLVTGTITVTDDITGAV